MAVITYLFPPGEWMRMVHYWPNLTSAINLAKQLNYRQRLWEIFWKIFGLYLYIQRWIDGDILNSRQILWSFNFLKGVTTNKQNLIGPRFHRFLSANLFLTRLFCTSAVPYFVFKTFNISIKGDPSRENRVPVDFDKKTWKGNSSK